MNKITPPLWLLAELTYACPLQCPYCSNPIDMAKYRKELSTEDWIRIFREARKMGAVQLGFSGGEPLLRYDLEELTAEARQLGYYTNLITSGVGLTERRIKTLKKAGLDHIQLSIQAPEKELNDYIAGTECFEQKLEAARLIKKYEYPMVLNFVRHRLTDDYVGQFMELAIKLEADFVELAATQYTGWDFINRNHLLPTRDQLARSGPIARDYQEKLKGKMRIFYVVQDHYETRPKACMNGWGSIFLVVSPDGTALPCHSARLLPDIDFPKVQDHRLEWIWNRSRAFNEFRGSEWMKEPCQTCPEKKKDFGGCRCQAYLLTGDARNADPVCDKSYDHQKLVDYVEYVNQSGDRKIPEEKPLLFRNMKNSKKIIAEQMTAS